MYTIEEIELYLDDIKGYVNSALIYLKSTTTKRKLMDKDEIVMYLSTCEETIEDIKKTIYRLELYKSMDTKYLVNYLYYLNDKIDPVYRNEIDKSIYRIIRNLKGDNEYE